MRKYSKIVGIKNLKMQTNLYCEAVFVEALISQYVEIFNM